MDPEILLLVLALERGGTKIIMLSGGSSSILPVPPPFCRPAPMASRIVGALVGIALVEGAFDMVGTKLGALDGD